MSRGPMPALPRTRHSSCQAVKTSFSSAGKELQEERWGGEGLCSGAQHGLGAKALGWSPGRGRDPHEHTWHTLVSHLFGEQQTVSREHPPPRAHTHTPFNVT